MKLSRTISWLATLAPVSVWACADRAQPLGDSKQGAPVLVGELPRGYRDWKLVSVAREEGTVDDIRAVLANDAALEAFRAGAPYPDGAAIARVAWSLDANEENNRAFGKPQSFTAGAPKNGIQLMVRDSKRYLATGGWGYGLFEHGKPVDGAAPAPCFGCHKAAESRGFVFTRYAP